MYSTQNIQFAIIIVKNYIFSTDTTCQRHIHAHISQHTHTHYNNTIYYAPRTQLQYEY